MSLECPTNYTNHTSVEQKRKSQNAAKVYRYGTAKLREALREKCFIRAKEARQHCFSQLRPTTESGKPFMSHLSINDILRQELAELEHDIDLQNAIYNELLEEFNDWFAQDLEGEENYLVDVAEKQALVCPICQINNLVCYRRKDQRFNYRCKCWANFFSPLDIVQLQTQLLALIDLHELKCLTKLSFYVNPQTSQLEALCENCDYFGCL